MGGALLLGAPIKEHLLLLRGFPGGSAIENPLANAGPIGFIAGLGRSPGGGNGNPLQYSCQENSMDRGASQATVPGMQKVGHD